MQYQKEINLYDFLNTTNSTFISKAKETPNGIWYYNSTNHKVVEPGPGPYLPVWQTSPIFHNGRRANENLLHLKLKASPWEAFSSSQLLISEFVTGPPGDMDSDHPVTSVFALLLSVAQRSVIEYRGEPMSIVSLPIFDSFKPNNRKTVGVLVAWINWASYFVSVLPDTVRGIRLVLSDTCGAIYTFEIVGEEVVFLGPGDFHDPAYNHKRHVAEFVRNQTINDGTKNGIPLNQDLCPIRLEVYPSETFYQTYDQNSPVVLTVAVACVFVFTVFTFLFYDRLVERRQTLVLRKAIQSTQIVNTLFPENVRDRLMQTDHNNNSSHHRRNKNGSTGGSFTATPSHRLQGYLNGERDGGGGTRNRNHHNEDDEAPIADLFPQCTVFFADIAGFTAWSSSREPAQVFVLLQTLYQAFDKIAKKRKVFKVETIGDSYVAVTGLPQAQPNHAVIMARYVPKTLIYLPFFAVGLRFLVL